MILMISGPFEIKPNYKRQTMIGDFSIILFNTVKIKLMSIYITLLRIAYNFQILTTIINGRMMCALILVLHHKVNFDHVHRRLSLILIAWVTLNQLSLNSGQSQKFQSIFVLISCSKASNSTRRNPRSYTCTRTPTNRKTPTTGDSSRVSCDKPRFWFSNWSWSHLRVSFIRADTWRHPFSNPRISRTSKYNWSAET